MAEQQPTVDCNNKTELLSMAKYGFKWWSVPSEYQSANIGTLEENESQKVGEIYQNR